MTYRKKKDFEGHDRQTEKRKTLKDMTLRQKKGKGFEGHDRQKKERL